MSPFSREQDAVLTGFLPARLEEAWGVRARSRGAGNPASPRKGERESQV